VESHLGSTILINLWGLTGGGKTRLAREIINFLQLQDFFFEIDSDARSLQKL
jgi:hypothetical protein